MTGVRLEIPEILDRLAVPEVVKVGQEGQLGHAKFA
jgi:hypothetical protein